jgi:hypothetical protein
MNKRTDFISVKLASKHDFRDEDSNRSPPLSTQIMHFNRLKKNFAQADCTIWVQNETAGGGGAISLRPIICLQGHEFSFSLA